VGELVGSEVGRPLTLREKDMRKSRGNCTIHNVEGREAHVPYHV
jgi:hypothetical protein